MKNFRGAVVAFLDFALRHADMAERLADVRHLRAVLDAMIASVANSLW